MISVIPLSLVLLNSGLTLELYVFFNLYKLGSSLVELVHISSWLHAQTVRKKSQSESSDHMVHGYFRIQSVNAQGDLAKPIHEYS